MEKFSKINRKTYAIEFCFLEVRECNFTIKELHQKFFSVSFDLSSWDFNCMFLSCHVYVSDWIHTQLKRPHGHTTSLAKWLSVRLRTKWFWVHAQLQSLMRFYQYSKSKMQQYFSYYTSTVTLLNQWFGFINKEAPFPISRSEVFLWNCLAKKSWNFSRKMSVLEPCFNKVTEKCF